MLTYKSILYQDKREYSYIDLEKVALDMGGDLDNLPYSIRILLESLLRKEDGDVVRKHHIENLMHYQAVKPRGEVPFKPSRVILQDFTGVPVVVDLASMRDAVVTNGEIQNLSILKFLWI